MLNSQEILLSRLNDTWKTFTPPPKLKVSEWADKYRMLSPESSAEAGRWYTSRTPYLRDIMDAPNDPDIETVVVMSSSQVGKTEDVLNTVGFYIHQDPSPMLAIEPTLEIAEALSKDRIAPMLRDTEVLTRIVGDPKSKDGQNTLLHKKFPGGHLTLAGANSPAGLASRPIRILLCDEVDRFPISAGTEGDPLSLAAKRTTTFWNRKKIFVSTPTIKGLSRIEAAFEASDKRYFHVPCHKCGKKQKLEWEYVRWEDGKPETAIYVCRHCGEARTDAERNENIHLGQWIAEAPFKGVAGFHLNEMYNPWVSLGDMATRFLNAKHALDRGDPEPMRVFVNTSLGKTWEEKAETADPEPLLARRENYTIDAIPYRVLYLTAGVDVQDDRLEAEIVGWRKDQSKDPEESWGIDDIIIYGDPAKTQVWNELDDILKKEFQTEDGRRLRIAATAVDSGGHHTEAVYRFCNARLGRHVYAIKGADGPRPIWPRRAGKSRRYHSPVWLIGVDTIKDALYSRLRSAEPGPGYCHFPFSYELEYFKQLTAEQVKTRFVKGHPARYWFLPAGRRNEALDRRVYAFAALFSRRIPWEVLAKSAPSAPPERSTAGQEPVPPPPKLPPARPARKVRLRFR